MFTGSKRLHFAWHQHENGVSIMERLMAQWKGTHMYLWPDEFIDNMHPNGTIRGELGYFVLQRMLRGAGWELGDKKRWMLTTNGSFSLKSFYNFLNDGGMRCSVARFFWCNSCSRKINIYN